MDPPVFGAMFVGSSAENDSMIVQPSAEESCNSAAPVFGSNTQPDSKGHMCVECGEVFSKPYSLKRHFLTHTGIKAFNCEFCEKRFAHAYLLKQHLNMHSGERPFHCYYCGKVFAKPAVLKRHMLIHNKCQCNRCEKQFPCNDALDKHLSSEHSVSRLHLCLVCGEAFTFELMLQEHTESHALPQDNFSSPKSEKIFVDRHSLTEHEKRAPFELATRFGDATETQASPYFAQPTAELEHCEDKVHKQNSKKDSEVVCPQCGKKFSRADSLRRHIIGIHKVQKSTLQEKEHKPMSNSFENSLLDAMLSFPESGTVVKNEVVKNGFPCVKCGMLFTTDELLQLHQLVVHPAEDKKPIEKLPDCPRPTPGEATGQNSPIKSDASMHQFVGTGRRTEPIFCVTCKRNFDTLTEFEGHLSLCFSTMSGSDVGKEAADKTSQRTPSNSGRSKGPQTCELCGKQFADNYCLRRHMISHTGEKNHACEICGRKFAHSFHLTNHKKIHLGIKNFRCDVCEKTFTVNHALQRHLLTHPSTVVHPCGLCDKKFASSLGLQRHQLLHVKNS